LAESELIGRICIIICRLNTFSDYKNKKIRQIAAASRLYKRGLFTAWENFKSKLPA
jgi:hypothetical protein